MSQLSHSCIQKTASKF